MISVKLRHDLFNNLGMLGALLFLLAGVPAEAAIPAGFTDTLVTAVGSPTDLAFTPDGRLLITTKGGALRVFQGGSLLATPALSLTVCTQSERGLLGVAVDPDFANNSFVYLYYTASAGNTCQNRVSRFTLPAGNVINAATELVLVNSISRLSTDAGNHNGGEVGFGKDGLLYISIGDGGCDYANDSGCQGTNDASRDKHALLGKLLRITSTGGIPATNPFQGAGTGRCNSTGLTTAGNHCQETFAWGFRNPFRFAFDPNAAGTRVFVNDVGEGAREEIDEVQAGADFGWNCREGTRVNNTGGPCSPTPPNMIPPIFEYSHGAPIPGTSSPSSGTTCNSITGGAFVPDGAWPGYDGAYLASDYVCGWIFTLRQGAGGTWTATDFATSLGANSAVTLKFNPFNAAAGLYYTTFAGGGQIHRVYVPPVGPLRYFSLMPCRAVDTRNPDGPTGGPMLAPNAARTFDLAGVCGVPVTAKAVAVNVTAVSPASTGFLQLYPAGGSAPVTSTLNLLPGKTRANNAVVAVGANAGLTVFLSSGAGLHGVIDVVGYFQ
jgi:glucose/arabinose dehydrogenase